MGKVFKKSPVVVVNAVVLQDKQLADVPGSDIRGNLYRFAGIIFIIYFNYLKQKHSESAIISSSKVRRDRNTKNNFGQSDTYSSWESCFATVSSRYPVAEYPVKYSTL